VAVTDPVPASVSRWRLDAGEEAVLTLALTCTDCEVVLDDLAGRRCAAPHGVPLIGTLGIVILAKRIGRIAAARPVIEELHRAGLRASEAVIEDALKRANE
jgi:predicted nucleic acid-binding protein